MAWISDLIEAAVGTVSAVVLEALLGGLLIVLGSVVGWGLGQRGGRAWLERAVRWWLDVVVRPLGAGAGWARRAVVIAANNAAVCLLLVLMGSLPPLGWLGTFGVGVGLAVGVQQLQGRLAERRPREGRTDSRLTMVGLALNLLEPPAILIATGLCLGQGDGVTLGEAVRAYGVVVLPLLVVAAGGEALWMTRSGLFEQRLGAADDGAAADER